MRAPAAPQRRRRCSSRAEPGTPAACPSPLPGRRGGRWVEDEAYTASLGAGWQLEAVREACYKALAAVGKDAMHFRCGGLLGAAAARVVRDTGC